ncbi:uncharacterized protein RBU33_012208 [Hipposideros larvatus]
MDISAYKFQSGGPSKPSPPAAGSRGTASSTPEGRQANGKRAEVHIHRPPPLPNLTSPCCPAEAPQRADAPGPAACSPAAPAPPPTLPAPQRPPTQAREWEGAAWAAGATGVGAALLTLPGSGRLGRVPLTFREASPGPAPRARVQAAAGSREPGAAKAPSAQQRGGAPSSHLLAGEVELSPSLARLVRASVCPWAPPSLPRRRSSPGSAACPLPASPLCSRARGLAALSLAPCPRRYQRSAERSPAAAGFLARSVSRRGRQWGRGAGGAERRVRGRQRGCALGFRPISAGERLRPGARARGRRAAEGEMRRTRRLAADGGPGRGRARGSDSRARPLLAAEPGHLTKWNSPPRRLSGSPSSQLRVLGLDRSRGWERVRIWYTLPLSQIKAAFLPERERHDPKDGELAVGTCHRAQRRVRPASLESGIPPRLPHSRPRRVQCRLTMRTGDSSLPHVSGPGARNQGSWTGAWQQGPERRS